MQTTEAKKQNDFNSVEKSAVEAVTRLAEAKIAARDAARSQKLQRGMPHGQREQKKSRRAAASGKSGIEEDRSQKFRFRF